MADKTTQGLFLPGHLSGLRNVERREMMKPQDFRSMPRTRPPDRRDRPVRRGDVRQDSRRDCSVDVVGGWWYISARHSEGACCARNLPGRSRRPPPRRRRHGERPGPWPGAPRSGLAGLAFAPGGPPGQSPRHSAPRRTSATVAATPLATTEAAAPWAPTRSGRLHNDSYLAECSSSWRVDIEGTQSSVPCHHSLTGGCFGTIPFPYQHRHLRCERAP